MQQQLQEWIYKNEAFAGVECVQKDGVLCYNLCILKKEKEKGKESAKIVRQEQNLSSLSDLKSSLGEDMPIFLNLNVKGILHRQLDFAPKSEEEALSIVFPSAKISEFHVQQVNTEKHLFVSVIRKDTVNSLLVDFQSAGLWVVNVFIGPFWIEELLPILPNIATIQTTQHLLKIEAQHLVGFDKSEETTSQTISIGNDAVKEGMLLALCMAFLGITQSNIQSIDNELIQSKKEDFYYKKLFHYTSILALGFFFLALLINYFLFDHYNYQQQELQVEAVQQKNLLAQRDSLAKKYSDQKALLGDQLNLGQSKSSYYADQLAATLPSTLQFTNLVFFPVIKENDYTGEEKLPRYQYDKIVVTGECQGSVFYNNWKHSLEELNWVASIHNISYQNGANGQGVFKLEITLKHE